MLKVFDIKGRCLRNLVNNYKKAGDYSVNWDCKRFGSGIYFLKLSSKSSSVSKRVMVIK